MFEPDGIFTDCDIGTDVSWTRSEWTRPGRSHHGAGEVLAQVLTQCRTLETTRYYIISAVRV